MPGLGQNSENVFTIQKRNMALNSQAWPQILFIGSAYCKLLAYVPINAPHLQGELRTMDLRSTSTFQKKLPITVV